MMMSPRLALAACAFLLLLVTDAKAQTWNEIQEEHSKALRQQDWQRALALNSQLLVLRAPKPQDHCFTYWGTFTAHLYGTGDMPRALAAAEESYRCINQLTLPDLKDYQDEALRYQGMALRDAGRYDDALKILDDRLRLNTSNKWSVEGARGELLALKLDYEGAATAYTNAIAAAPQLTQKKVWGAPKAWVRVQQGRLDLAEAALTELERLGPRQPGQDANYRAWLLAEQGKYDAAIALMKTDEAAGGANLGAYTYLRAYVEAAAGHGPGAVSAFASAAAAQSANVTVQVALYLARARNGQNDPSALTSLAAGLRPDKWPDAQIFFVLGRISRGQFEAAARFGNLQIEKSRMCRLYLVAGELALVHGDKPLARTELSHAFADCPVQAQAQERIWAKGELSRL